MKTLSTALVLMSLLLAACVTNEEAQPQTRLTTCSSLAGEWVGKKDGRGYNGDITIVIKSDCSYEWLGSAGLITAGTLRSSAQGFNYVNVAGSRGVVTIADKNATWVNTFTGANYQVNVSKKSSAQ